MVQFQHIEYLFALLAVVPMWILYTKLIRWKKSRMHAIGDPVLVQQLMGDYSAQKFKIKFIFFVLGFVALVLGLSNPRFPQGETQIKRNGIDVMIALDVSKSMLAEDVRPNRITRGRQLISNLIDKLENDRIGIVVFAGRAYLQMPLTTDHTAAKMYLNTAGPDVVPTQGTVISEALKMCYASFNTQEKKYQSILLISDGEDHDDNALQITKAIAAEGVMVNTIGIGSAAGAMIPDEGADGFKKDKVGNPVFTKLNEKALQQIAVNGNGIYQLFSSADEVSNTVFEQLKKLGQRPITETSLLSYQNYFQSFLAISLLILLAEMFISEKKKKKQTALFPNIKKGKLNPIIGCLFLTAISLPIELFSQNESTVIKEGNDEYYKRQYAAASIKYKNALEKNPTNTTALFNLGNALFKDGKTDEALQAFDAAIAYEKLSDKQSAAWYNKGVLLKSKNKVDESIKAFKNALRLNPVDEDARMNLQAALQQQKKLQQKDQQKQQTPDPKNQKTDQPKSQQSKMSQKEAEEKLKALLQKEKNLQDKLRKVDAASPEKPEKDW